MTRYEARYKEEELGTCIGVAGTDAEYIGRNLITRASLNGVMARVGSTQRPKALPCHTFSLVVIHYFHYLGTSLRSHILYDFMGIVLI